MHSAPLLDKNVKLIPDEQGVYQLLLNDQLVYIGKTDGEAGLGKRLSRHSCTIMHRDNLDVSKVTYRAIRIFVFTAVDLETQLIRHYDAIREVSWNKSGFGSNDPGRRREDTELKANSFDAIFPINIETTLDPTIWKSATTAAEALSALKDFLPYTFRFEITTARGRIPHDQLQASTVSLPKRPATVRLLLQEILKQLPNAESNATRTPIPIHCGHRSDDRGQLVMTG